MNRLLSKFSININQNIFLKDPASSDLGGRIVSSSIDLIEEIGIENFTFRKLAKEIGSTEASIYRYFENKNYLLIYLVHWYWGWMEYKLIFGMMNISDPIERLKICIKLLTESIKEDNDFKQINEVKLNSIVIVESSKIYLNKHVDSDNADGCFKPYKDVVQLVSDVILEVNSGYKYPHMLMSTIIEGAHHQRFFAQHLPKLTDVVKGEDAISSFYSDILFKAIAKKQIYENDSITKVLGATCA